MMQLIRQTALLMVVIGLMCVLALMFGTYTPASPIITYIHQVNPEEGQIHMVDVWRGMSIALTQYQTQHLYPTWSPDGDYLLFVMGGDFNPRTGGFSATRIIQMDMHTYRRYPLTQNRGLFSENMPAWSSTGKVAYARYDSGWDIIITRPQATQTRLIRTTQQGVNTNLSEHTPQWSDDGAQLAYLVGGQYFSELWVADANGAHGRTLTSGMRLYQGQYDWSPSGTHIAFTSERDGNREIYLVNVSNGATINLTRNSAHDSAPQWSPDGTQIAFISERSIPSEIFIMNADGSNIRQMTANADYVSSVVWSPDGRWLAYSANGNGFSMPITRDIFVMSADGGASRRLTFSRSDEYSPLWKPKS
ncbi:MAG: DPP IV N-terminal domain-containing protein [Anaerolineae bacterium]|nr:DPP IV N-terminal domain-containing protein [Anaerolineae bacterium]